MKIHAKRAARPHVGLLLSVLMGVTLGGCAGMPNGPAFSSLQGPAPGLSRVYVYLDPSDNSFTGAEPFPIKLDGEPLGTVRRGGFAYRDVPPGSHVLTSEVFGYPGTSRHELRTAPGRTYYVAIQKSERANAVTAGAMIGGIGGAVIMSAVTDARGGGPVDFVPKDEVAGRAALSSAKQGSE